MSVRSWPSSPLAAAGRAFALLVQPPTPVAFDGRGFDGLPDDEMLPLERLRSLLLSPCTGVEVRDAVWRELVVRARRDGPAWVVAAVGVALPGLRHAAGLVAAGWRGDTRDLDAELLAGFVARLTTIDLQPPRVIGRLIDAGVRAARKARDADSDTHLVRTDAPGPIAPVQPWDHPDLVLARAVAAGVLDADEAYLIAVTRLEDATLAQAATRIGISAGLASLWRRKAERRLSAAIHAGDLAFVPLRPRRRRGGAGTQQPTAATQRAIPGAQQRQSTNQHETAVAQHRASATQQPAAGPNNRSPIAQQRRSPTQHQAAVAQHRGAAMQQPVVLRAGAVQQ